MRHIRKTNRNVNDHRFRSTGKYNNKVRSVFCGAEPTPRDFSREDALHLIQKCEALRPDWLTEMCPACRAALPKD